MNNRSILVISSEFPPGPGGIGKHAYDLSNAFAWKGYQVTVFSSQDYANEFEIQEFNTSLNEHIHLNRFYRNGFSTYWNRWKLISKFLKANQPEMIIVTGRFSLWLGFLIKQKFRRNIKVNAFVHGSELNTTNRFYHFITKLSLRKLDSIWAVSQFTRKQFQMVIQRENIKILPNGLWTQTWNLLEKNDSSFSLTGNPALLTVGRISSRKGQHRVINALPVIKSIFKDVHYHIAGIPSSKETLLKLAEKLKVEDLISLHGKVPSTSILAKYYYSSHIFIMLSQTQPDGEAEGFGIAILEANFFGKPAIGAKGCGIEDAIQDGYNGRLVDGNDAEEITIAMNDIMSNFEVYSQNAKAWARKHDWKILIDRFINDEVTSKDEINLLVN